jgi:hypothetical protein
MPARLGVDTFVTLADLNEAALRRTHCVLLSRQSRGDVS